MESKQSAPEQRTIDVEVESIDTRGRTLHGYAAVYNVESDDLGGFRERIAPGAFGSVLDADVRALLNHDPSQVLGRTKSGTLRLHDERRGVRFEVDLPDSPLGENVREAVRREDIDGASFRFTVDPRVVAGRRAHGRVGQGVEGRHRRDVRGLSGRVGGAADKTRNQRRPESEGSSGRADQQRGAVSPGRAFTTTIALPPCSSMVHSSPRASMLWTTSLMVTARPFVRWM
jgi:HK97 family phage prohead protease